MSEFKEMFDTAVAEELDKDAITMILITEGGLSPVAAVREYNTLAREAGMLLTTEQKKIKIADVLADIDLTVKANVEEARDMLVEELDVAPTTAMAYIKDFAKENGIDLPISQRKMFATKEEVCAYLIEHDEDTKSVQSQGLIDTFGYAKGTSDTITSMLGYMKEYAIQANG